MNKNSTLIRKLSLDNTLASKFGDRVHISLQVWSCGLKFTLASKFGDRVHISLQVWSLGLKYTLASKFGAKVYFILQFTLATTYTYVYFGYKVFSTSLLKIQKKMHK